MDNLLEQVQMQCLDFASDKRTEWERQHKLYSVIFELTPHCNLKCVHCYLNECHDSKELSYDRIIEIIDILYEKEVLFLTLTGGDIFTRKDFLDIYMYAKKKGFIIELFTNGVLINDEIISILKKYPPLLVDISLYGSCEETFYKVTGVKNVFEKVLKNIQNMLNAGIRVSMKAPVLNLYYSELPKIKEIADEFGIPFRTGFEIFPSINNDDSVQQYSVSTAESLKYEFSEFVEKPRTFSENYDAEMIDLLKEKPLFRCKLGRASCAIDYEGRMCPCMSFRHVGEQLTRENFERIWNNFSQYTKMKASEDYQCLSCKAYDFCDICPAMMQFVHGDLEYVDKHFCKSAKARYDYYIRGIPAEKVISAI